MSTQIGFTPPPPPRKWRFDIGGHAGMIKETVKETVTGNKIYFYDWCSESGNFSFGILQSETRQSNEVVEAKALKRAGEPGLGLVR
jgi:hypothetical protein